MKCVDGGRAGNKAEDQIKDLEKKLENATSKKDKKKLSQKIKNIKKDAAKKKGRRTFKKAQTIISRYFMYLILKPEQSVGDFKLNENIKDYLNDYNLEFNLEMSVDSPGWGTYDLDDEGLSIHVEDSIIVSIACYKKLIFKNENIIGMSIEDIIVLLDSKPEDFVDKIVIDDKTQLVYEFDDLGLQVWTLNGVATTCFCTIYNED